VRPENKGFKNPFEIKPNPLQKLKKTNTESKGHNPRVDLCPLIEPKIKNLGLFSKNWVSGGLGIKWEFWGFGWPAVGGFGGEWPAVVF
jgi:hypothetical protein